MSAQSRIEWTEQTWNPTTGCDKVSPGCDNCYAMTLAKRLKGMGQAKYQRDGDPRTSGPGFGLTVHEDTLTAPLHWRKPRRVFVNSMSDLFHAEVPDSFIAEVFAVMALAPQHTFQVLTKRHARMRSLLNSAAFWTDVGGRVNRIYDSGRGEHTGWASSGGESLIKDLDNVWLGVSAEDQHWADIRIPVLLETPAAVRFVSAEPLLGRIDLGAAALREYERQQGGYWEYGHGEDVYGNGKIWVPAPPAQLDWVIVGGESGPGARVMDLDWPTQIVQQCQAAGVPVFVKQLGSPWGRTWGADHHDIDAFPPGLRVREYPTEEAR